MTEISLKNNSYGIFRLFLINLNSTLKDYLITIAKIISVGILLGFSIVSNAQSITCPPDITIQTNTGCTATGYNLGLPTTLGFCDGPSISNTAIGPLSLGLNTITWLAFDTCGNLEMCDQLVIVEDGTLPEITNCPVDNVQSVDITCQFVIPDYTLLIIATDNCDNDPTITQLPIAGSIISDPGTIQTITITVEDDNSNTETCSFDITLEDLTAPVITDCLIDITESVDVNCEFTIPNYTALITATDNCDNDLTVTQSPIAGTIINEHGTIQTITFTVEDDNSNTETCSFEITLEDLIAPIITDCSLDITEPLDTNCEFTIPDYTALITATDNCDNTLTFTQSPVIGTIITGHGTIQTITFTVEDDNFNTETCSFNITLQDTIAPTIICPIDVNQTADASLCQATVIILVPTTADNCSVVSVTNDFNNTNDASGTYPIGTTTVVWSVTDINGNITNCSQDIIITDDENPTITCPMDVVQLADNGICNTAVIILAPVTADNCSVASVTNDFNNTDNASDTYPVGTTTVVWTVTDINGNTATCSQDIIITDDQNPTITCPVDVVQFTDFGLCNAAVTILVPLTTDNCSVASVTNDFNNTDNASDTYPVGTTTVLWTVIDASGNTTNCSQNIVITDNQNPIITCPVDVAQFSDNGVCNAVVTILSPVSTDNCSVVSVTNDFNNTDNASDTYPEGTTIVVWTVIDASGNTAICSQDVVITDNQNPTITCPLDVIQNTDFGIYTAAVTILAPATADNCSVTSVTNDFNNTNDASGTYPIGSTTVVWTVIDIHGNANTCSQTVVISDGENPTITCPINQTVAADINCQFTMIDYTAMAVTSDNCDILVDITQLPLLGTLVSGTQTVTLTATDDTGNTSTCAFDVVVDDTTDPVITECATDVTEQVDANCEFDIIDYTGLVTATDNCDLSVTITQLPLEGTTITGHGTIQTVTITVTDDNGNFTTCNFDITLHDSIDPTITCPADVNQTADNNGCDAAVTISAPTTADNCSVISFTNDFNNTDNASDTYQVGTTTTVVWTVTDINGNTATCSQDIIITDDEIPTITCPVDVVQFTDFGLCNAAVTILVPLTTDNCSVASVTNDFNNTDNASDTYPVGTTTVLWTVIDASGNTTNCSQDVVITDDQNPIITCPVDVVQFSDNGVCNAVVTILAPVSTDNCSVVSVSNDFNNTDNASDTYPEGTTTVVWTVIDASGNTAICSQDVVITDNQNPTITCPLDVVQNTDFGICTATVTILAPASADNCSVTSVTNDFNNTNDASDTYPIGSTTVVWTVIDIHGNLNTCSQTVVISDGENPTITCPINQTVAADINCQFTMIDYTAMTATSDNCDILVDVTQLPLVGTLVSGTQTVTLTATDDTGNTSTCAFDVVVDDTTDPVITECATDVTEQVDVNCEFDIIDYTDLVTATDNCDLSVTITQDPIIGTTVSGHGTVQTVIITATDNSGNFTTCTFDITLEDLITPIITDCPVDIVEPLDVNCEFEIPDYTTLITPTDNCDNSLTITQSPVAGTIISDHGTQQTITFTVEDDNSNSETCSFDITLEDQSAPVISSCPIDSTEPLTTNCEFTISDYTALISATDNCSNSFTITQSPLAGTIITDHGTVQTITFTVEDDQGNSSSCSFNITLEDITAPVITDCLADITESIDANCEFTIPDYTTLITATDNCDNTLTITQSPLDGAIITGHGTEQTITFTVEDDNSNLETCSFNITLEDITAPVITDCPVDITEFIDSNCEFEIPDYTALIVTADNCDNTLTITQSPVEGSIITSHGTIQTITFIIEDDNSNLETCSFNITLEDIIAPLIIDCPLDIIVQADANCEFEIPDYTNLITATDNCNNILINTQTPIPGTIITNHGTVQNITFTIEDTQGNSSSCSFEITLEDTTPPVIICENTITQTTDVGEIFATLTIISPSISENCGTTELTNNFNNSDNASGEYPIGETIIVWAVVDEYGNSSICNQLIIINDNEGPVIECPQNVEVNAEVNECSAFIDVDLPTAEDNNIIVSTVNNYTGTDNASAIYPVGTTSVIWTSTDIDGNNTSCEHLITVLDVQPPTINCQIDITANSDENQCGAFILINLLEVDDNCGIETVENDYNNTNNATGFYPVGNTEIIWTVTDIHGNSSNCSFTIVVNDNETPIIQCQDDIIQSNDLNTCGALVTLITPIVTDNCGVQSIVNDFNNTENATDTYPVGETIVIWTAVDINGNETSCVQSIIIEDIEIPSITCSEDIIEYAENNLCEASITIDMPIFSDNCTESPAITNNYNESPSGSGFYPVGVTELCYTVLDLNGNTNTCCINILIIDTISPQINCPDNITIETENGSCTAEVIAPELVATDNCTVSSITNNYTNSQNASGNYPLGETVVEWTVTDLGGNQSYCSQIITVIDVENPVISCAETLTVFIDENECSATITLETPVHSDNCQINEISNNINSTSDASGIYPVGSTEIIWTVSDISGNISTCTQEIIVIDNQEPEITCLLSFSQSNDASSCDAYIEIEIPVVFDNCEIATLNNDYNNTNNASDTYPIGETIVIWTVADINGNSSNCETIITIIDPEVPTIDCSGFITVSSNSDSCTGDVIVPSPTTSDNCAIQSVINDYNNSNDASDNYPIGTTVVTWTVADLYGNEAQCSFNITVVDETPPVVTCQDNIDINNEDETCGAIVSFDLPIFTDNCDGTIIQQTEGLESGETFPIGTTTQTYTVTDAAGNETSCSFTITVIDTETPTITCVENIFQEDPVVTYNLPEYSDNCSVSIELIEGLPSGSEFPHGTTTVSYQATDSYGNSTICSFEVLINMNPVAEDDHIEFLEEDNTIIIIPLENDWDPDDDELTISNVISTNNNIIIEFNNNTIEYTPIDGWCGSDTISYTICDTYNSCDSAIIYIEVECYVDLIIPEGFSPNNNGINDTFEIIGVEDYPNNHLEIFNRKGQLVYEKQGYQNEWNGKAENGIVIGKDLLPVGTYFYIFTPNITNGDKIKGYIFLNY